MNNKYKDIVNILYNKNLSAVGRYYYLKQLNCNSVDMININNQLANKKARENSKELLNNDEQKEIMEYIKEITKKELTDVFQKTFKDL